MSAIDFAIPTRNRQHELDRTLTALGELKLDGSCTIFVVDNASASPARTPSTLANGMRVSLTRSETNLGAAARNLAAERSGAQWLCMLDDDSRPLDAGFVQAAADAPSDVAIIGAEIFLPDQRRESGGLPEVPVGCAMLIRRREFLDLGAYDPAFVFYAEEYDLAARMVRAGHRMVWDRRFRVLHRKASDQRDMNEIMRRLVRNSAWVEQRYAPDAERSARIEHIIARYAEIAERENAREGYELGLRELSSTLDSQQRTPLTQSQFNRLTGESHVRAFLPAQLARLGVQRIGLSCRAKHWEVIARVLRETGRELTDEPRRADLLVAGSLSPGPMLDELDRASGPPVIAPWAFSGSFAPSAIAV